LPDAVVYPENSSQIAKILEICNRNRIPVIAYGAGSGLEGGINPTNGGISIDTSKHMNNILEVNVEDFDCKVKLVLLYTRCTHIFLFLC